METVAAGKEKSRLFWKLTRFHPFFAGCVAIGSSDVCKKAVLLLVISNLLK
jgi:hypothetical protein